MRDYLEQPIKDLMQRHPGLGDILGEAGVGCTTCSLGTCKVRDILEIHNLDTAQARELLTRMGRAIHGDAPFEMPSIERKAAPPRSAFCPPIARMVEEHRRILQVIAALPSLVAALRLDPARNRPTAERALDFIRHYADRYHHAKEEDILFGYFDPQSEILQVMLQDHEEGRAHVQAAAEALAAGELDRLEDHFSAYGELLKGHIQREDEILYPWMDRTLSTREVGELYARCAEVDRAFGEGPGGHERFAESLLSLLAQSGPAA